MNLSTITLLAAAEGEAVNPLIPHTAELVWGAISFFLLLLVMSKVLFPRVSRLLAERSANIEGKLAEAEAQRAAAQQLLGEYQARLDEARDEAGRIVEQARANADRLQEELRLRAEDQAARIVERAQETITAERDRALATLRSEVGVLAVDLATKVVGDSLDRDRQLRLVDQYISELSAS